MIHQVYGKVMIDCSGCESRVEIAQPRGTVECPWCHQSMTYNTGMNDSRFAQLKRTAREKHLGIARQFKKSKWQLTQEQLDSIRAKYDGRRATVQALAKEIGIPRNIVIKRAQTLGLTRPKMPGWTPEDETYLRNNYGLFSPITLSRHLHRSPEAIRYRVKRLRIKLSGPGYTARSLALVLGVEDKYVRQWVRDGLLTGRKRGSLRYNDFWYFTAEDVRDFLVRRPLAVDFRKVDQASMIEILAGVKIQDEAIFQKPKLGRAS